MKLTFLTTLISVGVIATLGCTNPDKSRTGPHVAPSSSETPKSVSWAAPNLENVPPGAAKQGLEYAQKTYELLPKNVGNKLHCTSCHLKGGTEPLASPWVGSTHSYPRYNSRVAADVTLSQRINSCFERSMNGESLDEKSPEMDALIAYMAWLSKDIPKGEVAEHLGIPKLPPPGREPDSKLGEQLFSMKCQACHGAEGAGNYGDDGDDGEYIYPALWGDDSFNVAAGMGRRDTFASFIKHKMPYDEEETLSEQEAYDIAQFVTSQERPDFPGKENDWPEGGAPKDVPYELKSEPKSDHKSAEVQDVSGDS